MDNRPMVVFENRDGPRPGTKFNFGSISHGTSRTLKYANDRLSELTAMRVGAQVKMNCGRPLTEEERQWLDRPIPRKYLRAHE